jgi:fido (protein-threonine AMPylation protein)
MNNEISALKYNNVTLEDIPFQTLNYDLLVKIHLYLFNDIASVAGEMRVPSDVQEKINHILTKLDKLDVSKLSIHEIAENLCRAISIIWLYQPFFDGNSRVLATFLKLFLLSRGIDFKYTIDEHNEHDYKKIISVLYSPDDNLYPGAVNFIESYLQKQDMTVNIK